VSGGDTHGARMELQAHKEGLTPKQLVTKNHKKIVGLLKDFNLDFTNYSWTESPVHKEFVRKTYKQAYDNGFIITKVEKKPYCNNCKKFLADRFISGECPHCSFKSALGNQCDKCGQLLEPEELIKPKCEQCGKKDIVIKDTKHWYLSLDKLQKHIKKHSDSHPEWNTVTKEYTYRLFKKGLEPRPITRDIKWAIKAPFPGSAGKTIYVWADAVLGYVSASIEWAKKIGKPNAWKKFWKQESKHVYVHGKDNIPFHTIILSGLLIASGKKYTLPSQLSTNYYLNWEGGLKFSKTRGVGLWSGEALMLLPNPDVWSFYLMLNRPEKRDREFSWKELDKTINSTLVGSIGNLFNRCLTFIKRHYKEVLPKATLEKRVENKIINAFKKSSKIFELGGISDAIKEALKLSDFGNEYFQSKEPWHNEKTRPQTLYNCYQIIHALTVLLEPVMPATSKKAWKMLGLKGDVSKAPWEFKEVKNARIKKPELLFTKVKEGELKQKQGQGDYITYKDFSKAKILTAKIISAVPHDKYLKLKVKADKERTLIAGIKGHYNLKELIGKTIIIVANLEPRKIAGVLSEGMLLAAEKKGKIVLLTTDKAMPENSEIK
jgi:methionyl-tRNA synthetase